MPSDLTDTLSRLYNDDYYYDREIFYDFLNSNRNIF